MYITRSQIIRVSGGNPGALSALIVLDKRMSVLSPIYVEELENKGIAGTEIAVLFQVACDGDPVKFCDIIGNGQSLTSLQQCPESKFYIKKEN